MSEEKEMTASGQAYSDPLVTIGLPTYNRPAGLRKSLEGILKQRYSNLEIVISDNCSTNTEVQEIILEYALKDNRIKHYRQKQNIGLEENFNFVFAISNASYFIWMSDDDYFEDNYVSECVHFLEKNPDYVLCSGIAKYYSGDDFLFDERMFQVNQQTTVSRLFTYFSSVGKNGNFYGVFRNRLFAGKPIGIHIGCDWSFMGKLAILGKLTFLNTTSYHRSADGNSGTKKKMIRKFGYNTFQSVFFETYSAYTISTNIFNDHTVRNKFNLIQRKLLVVMIFFEINYILFVNFVRTRILGKPRNY
jgi:glycosyltransferase involved in cell wall biosynthesis